jgi:pimeloyl-ACP methyl ester carboxylesterase
MFEHMESIRIDSRRLFFLDRGAGLAVVLLHGALPEPDEWDLQIPVLCDAQYRVVSPMRAGHGQSDPHEGFGSRHKDACDVLAILDHLQIDQAVLVGHSAGAFVALQFYLAWPERVRAIASVDSAAFGKLDCKGLGQSGYDQKTKTLYEKHKAALMRLGRTWDYPGDDNVRRLDAMYRFRREKVDVLDRVTWKPDRRDYTVPSGQFCRVPLLVFTTGRGHIRPGDSRVEELRGRLPSENATLVAVVDSGHWIHRDLPEVFNTRLLEFLQAVEGNSNAIATSS